MGYLGGRSVARSTHAGWMNEPFQRLSLLGLAAAFAGAELVGGNGSIAAFVAFVAGLTLGNTIRAVCARVYEFGEAEGQLARPCGSVGSFAGAKLLRRRLLDRIDAGAHAEILPGAVESKRRKLRRA